MHLDVSSRFKRSRTERKEAICCLTSPGRSSRADSDLVAPAFFFLRMRRLNLRMTRLKLDLRSIRLAKDFIVFSVNTPCTMHHAPMSYLVYSRSICKVGYDNSTFTSTIPSRSRDDPRRVQSIPIQGQSPLIPPFPSSLPWSATAWLICRQNIGQSRQRHLRWKWASQ